MFQIIFVQFMRIWSIIIYKTGIDYGVFQYNLPLLIDKVTTKYLNQRPLALVIYIIFERKLLSNKNKT